MRKALILNEDDGVKLAKKLNLEGVDVALYDSNMPDVVAEKLEVNLVRSIESDVIGADVVFIDSISHTDVATELIESGKLVIGANSLVKTFYEKKVQKEWLNAINQNQRHDFNGKSVNCYLFFWPEIISDPVIFFLADKFMEHNKGADVAMGGIGYVPEWGEETKQIAQDVKTLARGLKYSGPIVLSCTGNPKGLFIRDVDISLGGRNLHMLLAVLEMCRPPFKEMIGLYSKAPISVSPCPCAFLLLSRPPFPFIPRGANIYSFPGIPEVLNPKKGFQDDKFFFMSYLSAVAVSWGWSYIQAKKRLYRSAEKAIISDIVQYRVDIGGTFLYAISKYVEWGIVPQPPRLEEVRNAKSTDNGSETVSSES